MAREDVIQPLEGVVTESDVQARMAESSCSWVRGPTIGAVTAGWCSSQARATSPGAWPSSSAKSSYWRIWSSCWRRVSKARPSVRRTPSSSFLSTPPSRPPCRETTGSGPGRTAALPESLRVPARGGTGCRWTARSPSPCSSAGVLPPGPGRCATRQSCCCPSKGSCPAGRPPRWPARSQSHGVSRSMW